MDLPNIIIVVFDTMRFDTLIESISTNSAPVIAQFAKESTSFENSIAPSSWTIPSHASLFLGKYPKEHDVHESERRSIKDVFNIKLPENGNIVPQLRKAGYNTLGYSGNFLVSSHNGFDTGFNVFSLENQNIKEGDPFIDLSSLKGKDKIEQLFTIYKRAKVLKNGGFPRKKGGENIVGDLSKKSLELPFFLFINTVEMHEPYTSNELSARYALRGTNQNLDFIGTRRFPRSWRDKIRRAYQKEIEECDYILSKLLAFLRTANLYDSSMIILTSDHGQSLWEKGYFGHGGFLHDEIIRVPLIIKPPKRYEPQRVISNGYASLVSIKNALIQTIDTGFSPDSFITPVAFSEKYAYGPISHGPEESDKSRRERLLISGYRSVYKNGYKMTIETTNFRIAEFTRGGIPVKNFDKKIIADLSEELEIFSGINGISDDIGRSVSQLTISNLRNFFA